MDFHACVSSLCSSFHMRGCEVWADSDILEKSITNRGGGPLTAWQRRTQRITRDQVQEGPGGGGGGRVGDGARGERYLPYQRTTFEGRTMHRPILVFLSVDVREVY